MDKAELTLVIEGEKVKIRKRFAPRTRIVESKKLYNRKRDRRKGDDGYRYRPFPCPATSFAAKA